MKIQALSDLHLEHCHFAEPILEEIAAVKADVLVLAGDIDSHRQIRNTLRLILEMNPAKEVVFVPGNHEYYATSRKSLDLRLQGMRGTKRLHVLLEDSAEFDGLLFLGTTGWWDDSGDDQSVVSDVVRQHMPDFSRIWELTTKTGCDWGTQAKVFLVEGLAQAKAQGLPAVVVTHNAPSRRSIIPAFATNILNGCFVNAWDDLVMAGQPVLWVHGHTHAGLDYHLGATRVVCNPLGYSWERRGCFTQDFVLEVG